MRRTPAIFRRCRKHAHCKTSVQPQWHEFAEQREAHFAVLIQFWTHNLLHVSPSGATVAKKRVLRVYSSQPSLSLILDKVLRSAVAAAVPLTPTMVKLRTGTQKPFLNRCTNPAAHLAWQRPPFDSFQLVCMGPGQYEGVEATNGHSTRSRKETAFHRCLSPENIVTPAEGLSYQEFRLASWFKGLLQETTRAIEQGRLWA